MRAPERGDHRSAPTAKAQTSDQAPGEDAVQVNDRYTGGSPPPDLNQSAARNPGPDLSLSRRLRSEHLVRL
jgi:hypothetical protein